MIVRIMPPTLSHHRNREDLLALLTEPGHYPLEVRDDSMVEIGIYRGDTVVVQSQQHASDGDIVVALIDNEEVALKRIRFPDAECIELLAGDGSEISHRLARSRVAIQGKIVGQIRRYR